MLTAKSRASNFITKVVRQKNTLLLISQAANVRLIPVSDCVVRIICVKEEDGEIEEWLEQKMVLYSGILLWMKILSVCS